MTGTDLHFRGVLGTMWRTDLVRVGCGHEGNASASVKVARLIRRLLQSFQQNMKVCPKGVTEGLLRRKPVGQD